MLPSNDLFNSYVASLPATVERPSSFSVALYNIGAENDETTPHVERTGYLCICIKFLSIVT